MRFLICFWSVGFLRFAIGCFFLIPSNGWVGASCGNGFSLAHFLSGFFSSWGGGLKNLIADFFRPTPLGFTMLKSMLGSTGPAAISGVFRSAVPCWAGRQVAPVAIPAAAS